MKMTTFSITNKHGCSMCLIIEPEGIEFTLDQGSSVTVVAKGGSPAFDCSFSNDDEGMPCVAIWPCEGSFDVLRNGVNILSELG